MVRLTGRLSRYTSSGNLSPKCRCRGFGVFDYPQTLNASNVHKTTMVQNSSVALAAENTKVVKGISMGVLKIIGNVAKFGKVNCGLA